MTDAVRRACAPRPQRVVPVPIADIAARLRVPDPGGSTTVRGVSLSSGRVEPGDLYAALPGARAHGADFAAQAAEAGATAVLTDPAGRERVAATGLPVLVVHGEDDDAWSPAVQADMAERLGAAYAVVPDAVHSPAVEQPEATAKALLAFFPEPASEL